jgi:multisubunit Na+/H+ antiporter MnhB subunit
MTPPCETGAVPSADAASQAAGLLTAALALILYAGLAWAIWLMPEPHGAMAQLVRSALPESGVQNPVTAVLLNFRGYDTLLEVAVLLLGSFSAYAINGRCGDRTPIPPADEPFVLAFFRLMAPVAIVVAGYILWVGKHAPGGAFQAGSILAAVGILAVLTTGFRAGTGSRWHDPALVLGLFTFCTVGLGTMGGARSFLQYPGPWAGELILLIESAAAFSIAAALVTLFISCLKDSADGRRPSGPESESPSSGEDP